MSGHKEQVHRRGSCSKHLRAKPNGQQWSLRCRAAYIRNNKLQACVCIYMCVLKHLLPSIQRQKLSLETRVCHLADESSWPACPRAPISVSCQLGFQLADIPTQHLCIAEYLNCGSQACSNNSALPPQPSLCSAPLRRIELRKK